jgi:hypothetical protein
VVLIIREPFAKFVDSPYDSKLENLWRCGDGLFFEVPPLASDELLTTLHPLSKTCCRPFAASFRRIVEQAVLTSELPFHGWKSP